MGCKNRRTISFLGFFFFDSLCEIQCVPAAADPCTTHPHIEDTAGVGDGLGVGLRVGAAAANVEADPDDLQPQLLGSLQETAARSQLRPKLDTEATHRLGVVGGDAQHQPAGGRSGATVSGDTLAITDLSSFSVGKCLTWRCRDNGPLS